MVLFKLVHDQPSCKHLLELNLSDKLEFMLPALGWVQSPSHEMESHCLESLHMGGTHDIACHAE